MFKKNKIYLFINLLKFYEYFLKPFSNHLRFYFDLFLGLQLGLKSNEDWYSVTNEDVIKHGGSGLLAHKYSSSFYKLISTVYSDVEWTPWKFTRISRGYWNDINNQRKYLDWLGNFASYNFSQASGRTLGLQSKEHWYLVTNKDFIKHGGGALLRIQYEGSIYKLLSTVYSEVEWIPWKFSHVPRGFWNDINNQRKYLDWLGMFIDRILNSDHCKV